MSNASLSDELTSPSPSPPPPPVSHPRKPGRPKKTLKKVVSAPPRPPKKESHKPVPDVDPAIDSGSELSELTEEDDGGAGEEDEDDEEDEGDDAKGKGKARGRARGRPAKGRAAASTTSTSSGGNGGGRKKRSSIVPAPMWGWAAPGSAAAVEEEEEEEEPGRPRALEEESGDSEQDMQDAPQDAKDIEIDNEQERQMEMDVDEQVPDPTIPASESAAVAAATLLNLFAVASSPSLPALPLAVAATGIQVEHGLDEDVTESEGEPASDEGEEAEEERVIDVAVEERHLEVTGSPKVPAKRNARREAAEDRPVSPVSQDAEDAEVDGPTREASPASERSAEEDGAEDVAEDEVDGDEAEAGEKSDIEVDGDADDAENKSGEEADLEADVDGEDVKSDGEDAKSDVEDDTKSSASADDVEMEVQPAHRAEALDVLAGIELKYALLREAVYLERMAGLSWEEALVAAGTHPELRHIQRELATRRDRRVDLATRKRAFEHADAERKRRVGEGGVWSWWKLARDELQTEMIAETNRKRRRLERERRSIERPQPNRRLPPPPPPQAVPLPPPSLRRIVTSAVPFRREQGYRARNRNETNLAPQHLVFPDLTPLSATDIQSDLDFMLQHQHPPPPPPPPPHSHLQPPPPPPQQQPHQQQQQVPNRNGALQHPPRGMIGMVPPPQQPPPPQTQPMYEPFPRPPPPQQQQFQQQPMPPSFVPPGFGRPPHHHHAPPPSSHHVHHAPPPSQQQQFEMYPPPFGPGSGRRPESPAGPGRWGKPGPGEWQGEQRVIGDGRVVDGRIGEGRVIGVGMPSVRPSGHGPDDDERERILREREREREREKRERERERERERDRDRSRDGERSRDRERERERDRDMLEQQDRRESYILMQQQHRAPPPPHHHHVVHGHRPHHHHVLHHHHPQSGGPPTHSQPSLHGQPPSHVHGSAPPVARPSLSPRASREFDNRIHNDARIHESRDRPPHGESRSQHQAELINLGPSKSISNDPASRWKGDRDDREQPPDYRKRPPIPPPMDDRERPLATPFAMTGSYSSGGAGARSMHTPPPANTPTAPRGSRTLEDAFRMPPSSSTSVGFMGDAGQGHRPASHPSSPRRYSQSSQGPPLPASSSSRAPSRPSGLSGLSPPLHRTLPPPSPSTFGGSGSGSRYSANPPIVTGPGMMAGGTNLGSGSGVLGNLGTRAPTPSRSPVLHRAERERLPSPPLPPSNKMMVGAMINGPPPPPAFASSPRRTTTPTVTSADDKVMGLRNDSPFVGPFANMANPAPATYPSKAKGQNLLDSEKDLKGDKGDKMTRLPSPTPMLGHPPPPVLPPIPSAKSERIPGL